MGLSRKRQRELNRLKSQAEALWDDQKEVLEHANKVVRDARRQAAAFGREEISPRLRDGVAATRSVASSAKDRIVDDVLPSVSSAIGSALALLEISKNKQIREIISRVSRAGTDVGTKVGIIKPQPVGPGRYILIGLGVVAAAAVAYAAWQTLRADDDLWIDDEPAPLDDVSLDDDLQ
jgi:hypothetical protein